MERTAALLRVGLVLALCESLSLTPDRSLLARLDALP